MGDGPRAQAPASSATAAACGRSATSTTSPSGTLAALEHGAPGRIYNICDDEPAPVREWLPAVAEAIGAPPPRHLPRWVGRLMGAHLVAMMCEIRGASNARAKRELGWAPTWPSWRDGIPALAEPRKEALR